MRVLERAALLHRAGWAVPTEVIQQVGDGEPPNHDRLHARRALRCMSRGSDATSAESRFGGAAIRVRPPGLVVVIRARAFQARRRSGRLDADRADPGPGLGVEALREGPSVVGCRRNERDIEVRRKPRINSSRDLTVLWQEDDAGSTNSSAHGHSLPASRPG